MSCVGNSGGKPELTSGGELVLLVQVGKEKRESHPEQGLKFLGAALPNKGEPMELDLEGEGFRNHLDI